MVAARRAPGPRLGALLLPGMVLAACLLRRGAGTPVESCPRSLDCTLQRREFCPPGSHTCGPCLQQFVEDEHGRCIQRKWFSTGRTSVPNLEEEIDLLADALAKQGTARLHLLQDAPLAPAGKHPESSGAREEPAQGNRASHKAVTSHPSATTKTVKSSPVEVFHVTSNDLLILGMIVVFSVAGIVALIVAAICWCRLQKEIRLAQKTDYPAQKLPGPMPYDKLSPGDQKLAQSAQMYHYQHQKQQMLSMEKHKEEPKLPDSASSDEENEDGDFTVYECPGLAPTGEMEVKNPLFDDSTLPPPGPRSHL
ncbi:neural proliferation differentiation and control protein 1 [Carettochelys insculpta]|uniref:neural proliferation differentiation and control protein 1 n=1 Tax=Carettochelys insculpta TaxID=44489 RepID=UPI003EBB6C4A